MDLTITDPALAAEFTSYITERREKALEEAMKYDNFLVQMLKKPVSQTPASIPSAALNTIAQQNTEKVFYEKKTDTPVPLPIVNEEPIVPPTAQEIVNHVKTLLGSQPFMVQGKIIEMLRCKGKRWQSIDPNELNTVLGAEVRNQNNSIRRFIIGERTAEKIYTYALTSTAVPNKDVMYYNADAHPGGVVFNNLRNVMLKTARSFSGDFTTHQVVERAMIDMPYMKSNHKKDFADAASTTLGQLAKMGKLTTSGKYKDRSFRVS